MAHSEEERLDLVRRFHEREGELPEDANAELHAVCHVTVENQVALGDETPVADTLDRLVDEGLNRHDAIHAIAGVFMEHLWKRQKALDEGRATPGDSTLTEDYFEDVKTLTAQQWRDEAPRL